MAVKDFTVVSNNAGIDNAGLGKMLQKKQVKRMIASYVGENAEFTRQYVSGELELVFTPQGTLAEKIRAGGAGIPAFYTPTGVNTIYHTGDSIVKYNSDGSPAIFSSKKESRKFDGKEYILEDSICGDFALVKAWKADKKGNLIYRKAAQNFNPMMATAGKITIAEVEEIVDVDDIDPENVVTSFVHVDRIILSRNKDNKPIEIRMNAKPADALPKKEQLKPKDIIVQRAACEVKNNMFVNLGIGIPMMVASFIPEDMSVTMHSENGIVGLGEYPEKGKEDADLINAGKQTVTVIPGASYMSSAASFDIVRGGHLDLTILGAMEVDQHGNVANWIIPRKLVKGMGGAMDLVSCPNTKVIIATEHCSKNGESKLKKTCALPLTGAKCVSKIITEKAVFEFVEGQSLPFLIEKLSNLSVDDIKSCTEMEFIVSPNLRNMKNVVFGEI